MNKALYSLLTTALQEVTIIATADLFHLLAEKKVCHKSELKSTCVKNGRNKKLSNCSCSNCTWDPNKDTAVKNNKADL